MTLMMKDLSSRYTWIGKIRQLNCKDRKISAKTIMCFNFEHLTGTNRTDARTLEQLSGGIVQEGSDTHERSQDESVDTTTCTSLDSSCEPSQGERQQTSKPFEADMRDCCNAGGSYARDTDICLHDSVKAHDWECTSKSDVKNRTSELSFPVNISRKLILPKPSMLSPLDNSEDNPDENSAEPALVELSRHCVSSVSTKYSMEADKQILREANELLMGARIFLNSTCTLDQDPDYLEKAKLPTVLTPDNLLLPVSLKSASETDAQVLQEAFKQILGARILLRHIDERQYDWQDRGNLGELTDVILESSLDSQEVKESFLSPRKSEPSEVVGE